MLNKHTVICEICGAESNGQHENAQTAKNIASMGNGFHTVIVHPESASDALRIQLGVSSDMIDTMREIREAK